MLSISDIKLGTVITHNGQPYIVIFAQHVKQGRGGANLKTKLKNLITGANLEITYSGSDKATEADLERAKANFLYKEGGKYFFMDNDTFEQFELSDEVIGEGAGFLKEGLTVDVLIFEGHPVSLKLPAKVELMITEAPPGVKGDTAGAAMKIAKLETGKDVKVPLFINQGEVIRVNTETGEYVERVTK
ncbi:MAG: elongation factor P [Candidatus Komeilibacteria bacterium]|nr:elongation factor P [Candidatus Komeilibacteria bacterium]